MSSPEVVIVDYGSGNLLSVQRALEYCGASVVVTSSAEKILSASRVILPGVGAFANAMQALSDLGLVSPLRLLDTKKTPLLGICLGMQLLLDESEEFGINPGLGLIPGRVISLPVHDIVDKSHKIPHIGWSNLLPSTQNISDDDLLSGIRPNDSFYFVHSFMTNVIDPNCNIAHCVYGGHNIPAVIKKDLIMGCQFHPEKSGESGLKILKNFISL